VAEGVHLAAVAEAAQVEWGVEDAEADTAGLRYRAEVTVAEEVGLGPRNGPVATARAGWLRTRTWPEATLTDPRSPIRFNPVRKVPDPHSLRLLKEKGPGLAQAATKALRM
jgi:hypothetical protein